MTRVGRTSASRAQRLLVGALAAVSVVGATSPAFAGSDDGDGSTSTSSVAVAVATTEPAGEGGSDESETTTTAVETTSVETTAVETTVVESTAVETSVAAESTVPDSTLSMIAPMAFLLDGASGQVLLDTSADGTIDDTITQVGRTEGAMSVNGTVEVICADDDAVLASTTIGADGSWSIPADEFDDDACAGDAFVRITLDDDRYVFTTAGDTPRSGPLDVGESALYPYDSTDPVVLTSIVRPDWELSLVVPAGGVFDGAPPWETADCLAAGSDCGPHDGRVRSNDTITYTWSVGATSRFGSAASLASVVVEQDVVFQGGASATFAGIPARCQPAGGGGAVPPSQLLALPDLTPLAPGAEPPAGSTGVRLVCNLGTWSGGGAELFQPVVRILNESPNGSSVTTTARAYAVDADDQPSAVPTAPVAGPETEVTAAPRYDLSKSGFYEWNAEIRDVGNGPEPGYRTYATIQIGADRHVGVEPLAQPITFLDDIVGQKGNGDPYPDMRHYIVACIPNPSGFSATVGGRTAPIGDYPAAAVNRTVIDSGTCSYSRPGGDPTADYTITLDGIDMSGDRYPTHTAGGASLAAGPFYVASYRVQMFIPYTEIDRENDVEGDGIGMLILSNRVAGFDPVGISGAPNFGGAGEPGYCEGVSVDDDPSDFHCEQMPGGTRSNNIAGPTSMVIAPGNFSKHVGNYTTMHSTGWSLLPEQTSWHSGSAVLQPGQIFDSRPFWRNGGHPGWTGSMMCDVFDNTMARLVPTSASFVGGTDDVYAFLALENTSATAAAEYAVDWVIEYASFSLGADDPIGGGYHNPSGRFIGDWSTQRSIRCDTGTWVSDPNALGIDNVNAVRLRPRDESVLHPLGVGHMLVFGLQVRNEFHGGPHGGELIPAGAVIANFGGARANENNDGAWTGRAYVPSGPNGETGHTDGDRVSLSRSQLTLQKRTVEAETVDGETIGDGIADFGATGRAVAGNLVVWEIVTALSTPSAEPAAVRDLHIVDVLPADALYDPECTASLVGALIPDVVSYDTPEPGQTQLEWHLGDWTPNTDIPALRICTMTNSLAGTGTSLVNTASASAVGVPNRPSDTHTVVLDQAATLVVNKSVDAPIDLLNDTQVYTLATVNMSTTLTIDAPTLIEVFPYIGDGTGSVATRNPASDYAGALRLVGAPAPRTSGGDPAAGTLYYTADVPATVSQHLDDDTATWCTEAQFGSAGCPAGFDDVTAFKFVGEQDLTPATTAATSGLLVEFTLQAGDPDDPWSSGANAPDDLYSNRFTAFSPMFANDDGFQLLASNRVTVRTSGFAVGNLVFEDRDADGIYDPAVDAVVPDGVTVELYGADGTLRATTATVDGSYRFEGLPGGDYYVQIPATDFGAGGLLDGWIISPAPASAATEEGVDEDDDVSHDAIPGDGGAVRSNTFTLSADVAGAAIVGHEPTGENLHGGPPQSNDGITNLAIDLALFQPPAIDIEKEVCTLADNSCDPGAALGAGGWSADGVDGIGPDTEVAELAEGADALWRIVVTNTGGSDLYDVVVTDALAAVCERDGDSLAALAAMAPGDSVSWTCVSVGVMEDIRPNTADVIGYPPGDSEPVTDIDTASVVVVRVPETTTTEPEPTTTDVTATQPEPTTTGVPTTEPRTTVVTTTGVATTVPPSNTVPGGGDLPATGADVFVIALTALAMSGAGLALVVFVARRRTT